MTMTPEERTTQVREALADLGDTPDAVAETLRALGVRGRRRSAVTCPVAVYLRDHVIQNPAVTVGVGPYYVRLSPLGPGTSDEFRRVQMPPAVVRFVERFDSRVSYEDLRASE